MLYSEYDMKTFFVTKTIRRIYFHTISMLIQNINTFFCKEKNNVMRIYFHTIYVVFSEIIFLDLK